MSDIFELSFRQDGTVALVTGAASGIGLATATMLASTGAAVVLTDLALAGPDGAAKSLRHEGLA